MYNLQKAKEEIDLVAKHTGVLTEHVIAVSERLQALEGALASKLNDLKTLIGTIEGRFTELQGTIVGGEAHHFETSAISDLGAKLALLHPTPSTEPPAHVPDHHEPVEQHGYAGQGEHVEPPAQNYSQHQDNHGNDYHHG